MGRKNIDVENLTLTGAHRTVGDDANITIKDDVIVIVTQAYGPTGENVVGIDDVSFDGYPAVTVLVEANGRQGRVHLSPFHGDRRKEGFTDIPIGTKCTLLCPITKKPLDHIGKVDGKEGADYYALYLTPKLSEGEVVAISDIWGDYHSRIVDHFELISFWAAQDAES